MKITLEKLIEKPKFEPGEILINEHGAIVIVIKDYSSKGDMFSGFLLQSAHTLTPSLTIYNDFMKQAFRKYIGKLTLENE